MALAIDRLVDGKEAEEERALQHLCSQCTKREVMPTAETKLGDGWLGDLKRTIRV